MDAKEIYRSIYQHFIRYDYKLFNSFIFDWESDFFAESSSGYHIEVEVKISRGDFFRDFQKPKHELMKAFVLKKTHVIQKVDHWWRKEKESLICSFTQPVITFPYMGVDFPDSNRYRNDNRGIRVINKGWRKKYRENLYLVNDYGEPDVTHEKVDVYAPYTQISITAIEKHQCPHRFYFAMPEGLVKPAEVPRYAGIIYINEDGAYEERQAPFLHKTKQDVTHRLLARFHNLWRFKMDVDQQIELASQVKESA